jgi:hypothetical protein
VGDRAPPRAPTQPGPRSTRRPSSPAGATRRLASRCRSVGRPNLAKIRRCASRARAGEFTLAALPWAAASTAKPRPTAPPRARRSARRRRRARRFAGRHPGAPERASPPPFRRSRDVLSEGRLERGWGTPLGRRNQPAVQRRGERPPRRTGYLRPGPLYPAPRSATYPPADTPRPIPSLIHWPKPLGGPTGALSSEQKCCLQSPHARSTAERTWSPKRGSSDMKTRAWPSAPISTPASSSRSRPMTAVGGRAGSCRRRR